MSHNIRVVFDSESQAASLLAKRKSRESALRTLSITSLVVCFIYVLQTCRSTLGSACVKAAAPDFEPGIESAQMRSMKMSSWLRVNDVRTQAVFVALKIVANEGLGIDFVAGGCPSQETNVDSHRGMEDQPHPVYTPIRRWTLWQEHLVTQVSHLPADWKAIVTTFKKKFGKRTPEYYHSLKPLRRS